MKRTFLTAGIGLAVFVCSIAMANAPRHYVEPQPYNRISSDTMPQKDTTEPKKDTSQLNRYSLPQR